MGVGVGGVGRWGEGEVLESGGGLAFFPGCGPHTLSVLSLATVSHHREAIPQECTKTTDVKNHGH